MSWIAAPPRPAGDTLVFRSWTVSTDRFWSRARATTIGMTFNATQPEGSNFRASWKRVGLRYVLTITGSAWVPYDPWDIAQ